MDLKTQQDMNPGMNPPLNLKGRRLILSSASPRRRELLEGLGLQFDIDTGTSFVERHDAGASPEKIPAMMSEGKSRGFHRELADDEILVTSDTMVWCGSSVMGKPHGRDEAVSMLKSLSGRAHHVTTALTLRDSRKMDTVADTAIVHFKELTDCEIAYYVDNFRPYDKAGAYGIQEWIGYIGITRIEGSFFTIMGLPVHLVYRELQKFL